MKEIELAVAVKVTEADAHRVRFRDRPLPVGAVGTDGDLTRRESLHGAVSVGREQGRLRLGGRDELVTAGKAGENTRCGRVELGRRLEAARRRRRARDDLSRWGIDLRVAAEDLDRRDP